jgi:methanogenic corrinoid protein MtbC1
MLRRGSDARDSVQDINERLDRQPGTDVVCDALAQSAGQHNMAALITDEIIPRLIAAHRPCSAGQDLQAASNPSGLDPVALADAAVATDAGGLQAIAGGLLARGVSLETLLLELVAPAARILGERWEDDTSDFVEVTLGLWRMQELVHSLAHIAQGDGSTRRQTERHILCVTAPGDQHSLGSLVLEEIFRRAGWGTTGLRGDSEQALLAQVAQGWFDIIALTVSVERNSATIASMVSALRAASRNPGVSIMVGGPVFNALPGLAIEVGADATASDARAALNQAELLVGAMVVGSSAVSGRAGHGPPHTSAVAG